MKTHLTRAADRGLKDNGWLRVFNDDFVQPGGFGMHGHANMEIISVMLAGSVNHPDPLGCTEVVHQDWVQVMSAGSGLRHEEHNVGEEAVRFLQVWLEPKLQSVGPRYQRRSFPEAKREN